MKRGPTVGRVRDSPHESSPSQIGHQQVRGLLGDLRLFDELGEPRAVVGDPLGDPGLGEGPPDEQTSPTHVVKAATTVRTALQSRPG
jgi:hypothetical protein